jgi:Sulfotransferase family
LNIVDAKIEVGKRELAAAKESFDWKSKKFLLVVTTWRSGSTFLSEMLASHPAVFLHYEPLIYFGRHQVREDKNPVALQQLKDTFNCM